MNKKNVLVVEDDEDMNALYVNILGEDYNVIVSADTTEARKKLEENEIDLIILDLMLPSESGNDFLSWLRKSPKYGKIEVLVVSIFMGMLGEVKKNHPDIKSVSKPFRKEDLLKAVGAKLKVTG